MEELLERVRAGTLSVRRAARLLRLDALSRVGTQLKLDLGRASRTGIPEVVLAEGKSPSQVRDAALAFVRAQGRAIVSRVPPGFRLAVPHGVVIERHPEARLWILWRAGSRAPRPAGRVAILTGGTSDARVAAEAALMARELGCAVRTEADVGVAGLARLFDALGRLSPWDPHVYVVCAGREGALAPVTAGLVPAPVVGVPVSTGYGHRGRGEAALSTMLQSCAPLVVVNIDAGLVAGAVAGQIAKRGAGAYAGASKNRDAAAGRTLAPRRNVRRTTRGQ